MRLSVEADHFAFRTLELRTFFRQFPDVPPDDYYRFVRGEILREKLLEAHPEESASASERCWNAKIGPNREYTKDVEDKVRRAVRGSEKWVLLGGPPCQAYSLAGRSRNKGNPTYRAEDDERQQLYVEYLQVLADYRPAVFVMENVKGLLSATLNNERVFQKILDDLQHPVYAMRREGRTVKSDGNVQYRITSLTEYPSTLEGETLTQSIVKAENYGIPQARHRVIIMGVREDLSSTSHGILERKPQVSVQKTIGDMPRLRSGISRAEDSGSAWLEFLRRQESRSWLTAGAEELTEKIRKNLKQLKPIPQDRGGEFVRAEAAVGFESEWFLDERIGGYCNHSTRGHMQEDLRRYFYAAVYAELYGRSPQLKDFPKELLPKHANVDYALSTGSSFSDRFRVQVRHRPSTTVVSHISKDGHYYIHYDPLQCRSLTVREAARLQTFPDNYFFCGPRTAQYVQVGNAVPPLLARQVGQIVSEILGVSGANAGA